MDVIFLILITSVLLFIAILLDKDILSPFAIFCESFLLSLIVLSLNINEWNVNLSYKTMGIMLIGYIIFLSVTLLCKKAFDKDNNVTKKGIIINKLIRPQRHFYNSMIFISLVIAFLYIMAFYNSVGGFSNLQELSRSINYYRISTSYNYGKATSLPVIIVQLFKIVKVFSLISMYIFINNYYFHKVMNEKNKFEIKYLLPFLIIAPLTLLTGNRIELATLIISVVILFNLMSRRYGFTLNIKSIKKYFIVFICGICLFSFTKSITGRTSSSSGFEYFSIYFGAPIKLLDSYMVEPKVQSEFIGKETFWSLNNTVSKIIGKDTYQIHLESKYINGHKLGNVYTAYRNLYQDFGIVGLIILIGIEAFIFNKMYYKIKNKKKNGRVSIYEILYSMMIHVLVFFSFSEQFYNSVVSLNYLILLILLFAVRFYLMNIKLKKGGFF